MVDCRQVMGHDNIVNAEIAPRVRCAMQAWLIGGAAVTALLLAPAHSLAAPFPPQGMDVFPSSSPICVRINGSSYGGLGGFDPATIVARSDPFGEGSGADTGGSNVPTAGCPACDANVSDADLTCWPAGFPEAGSYREIHTEMLDLELCQACSNSCTCAPPLPCQKICYLAGQPAFDALNSVGAAAKYRNSYGEVESKDPLGNPANDVPARSFFDVKGVISITPAPGGTSGYFVLADLNDSILMVNANLPAIPPPPTSLYDIQAGTKLPGGAGGACSVCDIPLADAVSGTVVGVLCCPARHLIESNEPPGGGTGRPLLPTWLFALLVIAVAAAGVLMLAKKRPV